MPRGTTSYGSNEDYSWVEERFGINPKAAFMDRDALATMVEAVRGDVLPTNESVVATLEEHLESRFEDLYDALDFIVENTPIEDRAQALRGSQYFAAMDRGEVDPRRQSPDDFEGSHTLNRIEELRGRIPELRGASDRLDAFHRFSLVERELEPAEDAVHAGAAEVDAMIQAEIDRLRGK